MKRGAELGRSFPREAVQQYGNLLRYSQGGTFAPITLGPSASSDIENGTIIPVTSLDAFRPGQQILFSLTVYNGFVQGGGRPPVFDSWVSNIRLKPWFLRQGDEFRGPGGSGGWTGNDQLEFGGGTAANNRAVWYPVVKMIDISEWQSVNPPAAAPPRHSTSIFVDEVWELDLQDPNTPAFQQTLLSGQQGLGRSASFMYVSHGYALGFTYECVVSGDGDPNPQFAIDLNWQVGTT